VKNGEARIVDISSGGAQVETDSPLNPTKKLPLVIKTETSELQLQGVVRRCRVAGSKAGGGLLYRAGLEFTQMHPMEMEFLEDALVDIALSETDAPADDATRLTVRVKTDEPDAGGTVRG
jgi:hypothetical protein